MPPKHVKKRSPAQIEANAVARVKGSVTGFLQAIQANLKTLGIIGFAIVSGALWTVNYFKNAENTKAIGQIWVHTGNYAHKEDLTNAINSLLITNESPSDTKP